MEKSLLNRLSNQDFIEFIKNKQIEKILEFQSQGFNLNCSEKATENKKASHIVSSMGDLEYLKFLHLNTDLDWEALGYFIIFNNY
jgi:hypothetical protein